MWHKVIGWKTKLLSSAGREVLIKSVLMAIPLYPMSCFKIPESVCRRISSIIFKYWWLNSKEENSTHWIKKTLLSRPKAEGGLNFWVMGLVNDALLAKQFWNIFARLSSMVSLVFKAR